MAKRKSPKKTVETVTTRNTVKTVTTTTAKAPVRRRPVAKSTEPEARKTGHGGAIAAIILILLLLILAAYLLMTPPVLTPAQQHSQFESQLGAMQNNNQNLTAFYLANAPSYGFPVNKSWSVQVTDEAPGNNTAIGQITVTWNGQSETLSIQDGIVNTSISPTYAVTLTPSEFLSFTQTVITRNTAAALADYSTYYLSGKLKYTQIR
jgi:hypothetical protein